ncbi:MAG TPA: energy transducer TonB [Rhizomicrobium sp.]|jgi:TonB family protein
MKTLAAALIAVCAILSAATARAASEPLPDCIRSKLTAPVPLTPHVLGPEDYPPLSSMLGEQGTTIVQYDINTAGLVENAKVSKSSGSLRLDDAAIAFVTHFKFKPALDGKTPAACHNAIAVAWSLRVREDELIAQGVTTLHPAVADYPFGAAQKHEEDTVIVVVALNNSGTIETATVARPSEYPDLNEASLTYLRAQKLKPAEVNGTPTKTLFMVAVVWSLGTPAANTPKPLQKPVKN